jgi:hypothetical protein
LILSLSLNILKDSSFKSGIFNIASRDTRPLKDFIKSIYVVSSSKSNLAYGKFMPSHKVSLYPSIDKLINQIGGFEFTKFEEAIGNIIQTRK